MRNKHGENIIMEHKHVVNTKIGKNKNEKKIKDVDQNEKCKYGWT
jgi:hypothetical protein